FTKYFAAFEILFLSSRVLVYKEKFRKHSSQGGTPIFSDVVLMRQANVSSDLFRRVPYVHCSRRRASDGNTGGSFPSPDRAGRRQAGGKRIHRNRNQRKGL
ncbi:MAG: hypothetical protein ACYCRE_09785, partial [Acidobacteriaceae bacterium]